MSKISSIPARLRALIHLPTRVQEIHQMMTETRQVVMELNHDIRSGTSEHLPLFLGYAERLRLDADSAIAVTKVVERQLDIISRRLDELDAGSASSGASSPGAGSASRSAGSPTS